MSETKQDEFNESGPAPKPAGLTVMDMPAEQFRQMWVHTLSAAMLRSGRGFRMDSPKRRPQPGASHWRGERRPDKAGTTKAQRALAGGYR